MSSSFGLVQADAGMNGCVTRSGYVFKIYLPNLAQTGVGELTTGGADPAAYPESNAAEVMWSAYAWPIVISQTGNRVFFINQEGEMVTYNNRGATRYTGIATGTVPAWNAALTGANMASPTAAGVAGADMNLWAPVQ